MRFTTTLFTLLATSALGAPIPTDPPRPFDTSISYDPSEQQDWGNRPWYDTSIHPAVARGGPVFRCMGDTYKYGRDMRECFVSEDAPPRMTAAAGVSTARAKDLTGGANGSKGPFNTPNWPKGDRGPFGKGDNGPAVPNSLVGANPY